jgi:hypothetical protein
MREKRGMMAELKTAFRVVTFQASREELSSLNSRHLLLGVIMTWLVGIGRWWEDPRANLFQHLGIGSVVYVFILALFLWLIIWPVCVEARPSYFNVLTFISFTAPPAILYAIPVRTMFDVHTGQTIRLWMLALVAGWRVALLVFYLRRRVQFSVLRTTVTALLPLTVIVCALGALNLEKVVFDFMGRAHPEDASVNDSAYVVLFLISLFSFYLFLPLLVIYIGCIIDAITRRRAALAKS